MGDESVNLPPGFLFSPTDEELVLHFLYSKVTLLTCHPNIIPDLDLSVSDPWELNGKALSSGNQYYFFTKVNEDRATESGYWKEIGVTETIVSDADKKVGIKKYLVFNIGEAPQGTETSWMMQEYYLCSSGFNTAPYRSTRGRRKPDQSQSKWALCRVYERNKDSEQGVNCYSDDEDDSRTELSWLDESCKNCHIIPLIPLHLRIRQSPYLVIGCSSHGSLREEINEEALGVLRPLTLILAQISETGVIFAMQYSIPFFFPPFRVECRTAQGPLNSTDDAYGNQMNVNPKTEPSSAPASDSSDVNDVDTTPMTLRIPDLIFPAAIRNSHKTI
ncbi:NAC domain-containing protein 104-like [Senna tora]|uniref:NAC domain-containing protein 104-like n=1 Tax=Senna tora TaxID=362788 RepID=A0A834WWM3_9FABA|nr:NAC domain-containing protein 104-like [Senna tora]